MYTLPCVEYRTLMDLRVGFAQGSWMMPAQASEPAAPAADVPAETAETAETEGGRESRLGAQTTT